MAAAAAAGAAAAEAAAVTMLATHVPVVNFWFKKRVHTLRVVTYLIQIEYQHLSLLSLSKFLVQQRH